jgi:SAM-dependent methyltransferase
MSQATADEVHGFVGAPTRDPARSRVESYLAEYYDELSDENLLVGELLAGATQPPEERPARALDVGCGPTLLYWALFVDGYDEHHGFDADEDNVAFLRDEIAAGAGGRVPARYRPVCDHLDARGPAREDRFGALCRRVRRIERGDAAERWPYADGFVDLVTMVFSLEVLPTIEAARRALGEARRVLAPGGRMVVAAIGETTTWRVGDYVGRCLHFTEESLAALLSEAGFGRVTVQKHAASTAIERDQGYAWVLFAAARRGHPASPPSP